MENIFSKEKRYWSPSEQLVNALHCPLATRVGSQIVLFIFLGDSRYWQNSHLISECLLLIKEIIPSPSICGLCDLASAFPAVSQKQCKKFEFGKHVGICWKTLKNSTE
jgi:hypothetical protein